MCRRAVPALRAPFRVDHRSGADARSGRRRHLGASSTSTPEGSTVEERLLRFNISEMGETLRLRILDNRYLASGIAVAVIAFFSLYEMGGRPTGLALWRLFGTTNQLLAGLALLAVTLYLQQRGKNFWFTGIPMLFMLVSTLTAMVDNLRDFYTTWGEGGGALFVVGSILLVLAVWLAVEAVLTLVRGWGAAPLSSMRVTFAGDAEHGASSETQEPL